MNQGKIRLQLKVKIGILLTHKNGRDPLKVKGVPACLAAVSAAPIVSGHAMDPGILRQLLQDFKAGRLDEDAVLDRLKGLPFESLGFATVDHHRALRQGFPEVVFCQGKTTDQVVEIARRIVQQGTPFLGTRADEKLFEAVKRVLPGARYNPTARTITIEKKSGAKAGGGSVLVISAGTSDVPIAEEAAVTVEMMGHNVERLYDVGIAGLHRLLAHWEKIRKAQVIIVVAGMEGALPSVVGGLVDKPVIAVPTSVGYGASFQGLAALLAMLNSCAAGVTVVNIDNGFGAGFAASLIVRTRPATGS